jgi:hypothetical protein
MFNTSKKNQYAIVICDWKTIAINFAIKKSLSCINEIILNLIANGKLMWCHHISMDEIYDQRIHFHLLTNV